MRNTEDSRIYSPFYKDGIGTIYFDIVNSFPGVTNDFIDVQIATNLTEEAILDGLSLEDVDSDLHFDNWEALYDWNTIPLTVLEVGGGLNNMMTGDTNLVLSIADGGDSHFYRVRTQLNYYGPIRFRIRRLSKGSGDEDRNALILVDNIIASYPPATVRLKRYGEDYDTELTGYDVIGCVGDFDKPFISHLDSSVNTRLHFEWVTNFQDTVQNLRVSAPRLWYRWRYLDQKVNPWQQVVLTTNKNTTASGVVDFQTNPVNTQLVSVAGIPLSDGVGDLEYYYSATVRAPYYAPRDYSLDSGGNFGYIPGTSSAWSEAITQVRSSLGLAEGYRTPALGTDYFVRVREGESDYKWVALCSTVTTNGTTDTIAETNRMELVGDHTWRLHYYVPQDRVGETFSFHFCGEELYTNATSIAYHSRTNVWHCDLAELPYIPYTSAAGLGYPHSISCKLDDAATHLLIEFNDETLSFSISHAAYQNFNAWTDALPGFLGHTNWNGMGAIGVSDKKQKFVLDMTKDGWENTKFTRDLWREGFDTTDNVTYPFDKMFDEHRTPNGWTAGHGQFVRSVRGNDGMMGFQMEGRGQGWLAMDSFSESEMPPGIDTVTFWARVAQAPRFDDFAWYLDDLGAIDYVVGARVSMGVSLNGRDDMSMGTPSVSLVGFYRPAKGCYEFRLTRETDLVLRADLYKWQPSANGLTTNRLATVRVTSNNDDTSFPQDRRDFNLLVATTSTQQGKAYGSNAYMMLKKVGTGVKIVCALSKRRTVSTLEVDKGNVVKLIEITDSVNALQKGTFGLGSTDCKAIFAGIASYKIKTTGTVDDIDYSTCNYHKENPLTGDKPLLYDWAYFDTRWKYDGVSVDTVTGNAKLEAAIPTNQTVRLEFKKATGGEGWQPSGYEQSVTSFATNRFRFTPRVSPSYQVRLRAGGESYDDVRTDVVIDEVEVRSWRAGSYPNMVYYNGQHDEWVYMNSVVTNLSSTAKCCTMQPARGLDTQAMGIRSPYLENGISMFVADYRNADEHAKLLLQVCTNLTGIGMVSETLTMYPPENYNWVTVREFVFTNAADRARGTLTHYMSYRAPVHGLIRLVVDGDVIRHCMAEESNPLRDVNYGMVTITSAYCYDEPALDMRSWYAWNFHSVGWNTADKRFAYLFDSPDGLSGVLNFSADDGENKSADAQGIGLSDRNDLAAYKANNSFVQCPPLTNGIGSVSFRARTFTTNDSSYAWVRLYGSSEPDDDQTVSPESWKKIADFEVTNTTYHTFSWSTSDDSAQYKAVRLEVAASRKGRDASNAESWELPNRTPLQRVLLDEISVGEPIVPRIVFRGVRPFRSNLTDIPAKVVENVTDMSEQPLLGESWGIQCTIEPQQMGDMILDESDDDIKVFVAFKRGIVPWGYENWSNKVSAVRLKRIPGTLTFRSSYDIAASIISPVDTPSADYPENLWQYYLWCEFKDKESGNTHRHGLERADWTMPHWYVGIKDLNDTYASQGFAGFTILDTISPKRAWINEVSICETGEFSGDGKTQFIEIAVPRGADLANWYISVMGTSMYKGAIATYGFDGAKLNPSPKLGTRPGVDWTNDYTVVSLRCPAVAETDPLYSKTDGRWDMLDSTTLSRLQMFSDSSFAPYSTYGIELVRPSGVIEHQIVVQGTNTYEGTEWAELGDGRIFLEKVKKADPAGDWFFAGKDSGPGTLGVFRSHGEDETCWTNKMTATPSELNLLADGSRQAIDPNWYLRPNGTNVWIYATVIGGHLHQSIGSKTNDSEVFIVRKGDPTNIVYTTDKWWRIKNVTTNEETVAESVGQADRAHGHTWTLNLDSVQSTLNIFAYSEASKDVLDAGLSPDDPYYPAVMAWLEEKSDENGLYDAKHCDLNGNQVTDRSGNPATIGIKGMYWLDMDPSKSGWEVWAGMGGGMPASSPVRPVYYLDYGRSVTNARLKVTMKLVNSELGIMRAPNRLLGVEPGSTSEAYDSMSPAWNGPTFKIIGALQRPDKPDVSGRYLPLRWFVFGPNSFDEDCSATIDVWDPHDLRSPGYYYGWDEYPTVDVWFKFDLSEAPPTLDTAEMLNKDSTFDTGGSDGP